jgi:hypothetical protein
VRLWNWSSENHHIGRADAAIRLLDDLAHGQTDKNGQIDKNGRTLICAHSHGGNVLALLTNLLGRDTAAIRLFFRASRIHYRWPLIGRWDLPAWRRVYDLLFDEARTFDASRLDLVTMGTPVRYGWDTDGYGRLLHIIHHRPVPGLPPHGCRFPPTIEDIQSAANGDLIQLIGIAGTNLAPPVWAWRTWLADIRLNYLLQRRVPRFKLLARWQLANRIHQDGTVLLVDYGPCEGHVGQHVAGHAVYTRRKWLLFHAEQIVQHLYSSKHQSGLKVT